MEANEGRTAPALRAAGQGLGRAWARLWRLPARPPRKLAVAGVFALGVALHAGLLYESIPTSLIVGLSLLPALAYLGLDLPTPTFRRRLLRATCRGLVGGFYGLAGVGCLSFTSQLGWALSAGTWAVIGALGCLAMSSMVWRPADLHLPWAVPFGLLTVACATAWGTESAQLRCDDVVDLRSQPGVRVVVPSTPAMATCTPGDALILGRYPRKLWEAPAGDRFLFTTQSSSPPEHYPPRTISGSVCGVRPPDTPRCVGGGTAHALVEATDQREVFALSWREGLGRIYAVPFDGDVQRARVSDIIEATTAEGFYDPAHDRLAVTTDDGVEVLMFRGRDLKEVERVAAPAMPDDTLFDPASGEGLYCAGTGPLKRLDGQAFRALAVRSEPFEIRALASSAHSIATWWSFSWACEWDRESRRVFSASANLGTLVTIDYDSGEIVDSDVIGLGMRVIDRHPDSGLLYIGIFLRGELLEYDAHTREVTRRWFVGRYLRDVLVSRDTKRVFAASNQGIVEVVL